MKNHELLDMIGEVSEEYVQAADGNVVRPRFRWKALAACAACAALVLCAYSLWPGGEGQSNSTMEDLGADFASPADPEGPSADSDGPAAAPEATQGPGDSLVQRPGLHAYLLVEKERQIMASSGVQKAPSGGAGQNADSDSTEAGEVAGGELPMAPAQGFGARVPAPENGGEVPVQEAAYYYERLMQGMGVPTDGRSQAVYPDWFGGAWLDGDHGELLTVAIVYGFRTPELEEQIRGWCGGTQDIIFTGAIYSQNHLDSLMEEIRRVFEELDCRIFLSYGVYPSDNCIHLDFSQVPSDQVLAALNELDPDGGAIFIQVFTDRRNILTDAGEVVCDPSRSKPAPGGVTQPAVISLPPDAEETAMPAYTENGSEAHYDVQPAVISQPPQVKG